MNKGKRLLSSLLAMMLLFCSVSSVCATDLQNQQNDLENQLEEAESEQASLSARIKKLAESMRQATENLDKKKSEIEEAEQDLLMAMIDESEQYQSMKLRIQYMYENSNVNYIELFLESESISDFLSKAEYIMMLSKYDREKLEEFQQTVRAVEEKELVLQAEYEELTAIQNSLIEQKEEAETLLAQNATELASIKADLNDVKTQIQQAKNAENKQQEAAGANQGTSNSGGNAGNQTSPPVISGNGYFTHPCPGMSYQSSYFGEVRYGIGDTRPHKGHDYAAPEGTPIYAAAAGTVVIAGYSYSAGYWVVINHGNGLVTKYMHMYQSPMVRAGSHVAKGQQIGGVGTTGQSTGNHLHFQVELNGVPVNPSNYM